MYLSIHARGAGTRLTCMSGIIEQCLVGVGACNENLLVLYFFHPCAHEVQKHPFGWSESFFVKFPQFLRTWQVLFPVVKILSNSSTIRSQETIHLTVVPA